MTRTNHADQSHQDSKDVEIPNYVPQTALTVRHYDECTGKRGLDPRWVIANCRSVTANEAAQYLGYIAKSDGVWQKGCNHQSQFKPDKPWKKEGDKKAPKYRSQTGEYDAMLPTHPTNPRYWDDIEALKQWAYKLDGHPCLVITEGFFKGIAGCANGLPTIALLGVEMGLTSGKENPQGRRYLVPTLERYVKAGFGFIISFDADCVGNKNVVEAQRSLAHQLKLFKVPVYAVTGLWTVEQGKGMDDYIQNNGGDRFIREVIGKAVDIEAWEKQFRKPEAPKTDKVPPADIVGQAILEDYRDRLLWNDEHKTWMQYELERPGVWSPVSEAYLESAVDTILESRAIVGYGSASYVANVVSKLRRRLFERLWGERSINEILPFIDGVLDLTTGQFHKHSPGHRLTWSLPRPYNAVATGWTKIKNWFTEATGGNQQNEEILLCFAAAVLRGRSDLQKFLHLIGVGGTGKSTYTRLLEAVIGSANCWNGSLIDLQDKHEIAQLIGKRLVVLPDQDKITGSLSNFKRLTGQDSLSGRRLYKDGFNFRYTGMAVVTSNAPIFHADGGSWLTRRIIMIPFDNKPVEGRVRDLESEFEPELSAFTSYLLSISNEEITRVLRRVGKGDVNGTLWQAKIRTDSIAAWVNDRVIHDASAKTQIGSDRDEWAKEPYNPNTSTLFGSYCHYCKVTGLQAKGKNNFSSDLLELCQQTLGWTDVKWDRDGQGRRVIRALRLRFDEDTTPTLDDTLTTDDPSDDPSDDLSDDLKSAQGNNSDDPDDLLPLKLLDNESKSMLTLEEFSPAQLELTPIETTDSESLEKVLEPQVVNEPQTHIESEIQVVRPGRQMGRQKVVSDEKQTTADAITPAQPQQPAASVPAEVSKADEIFSPQHVAAKILKCQSWVCVENTLDVVAKAIGTDRDAPYKGVLPHLSLDDRQHLVRLLGAHIRQFPHDPWAYTWLPKSSQKLVTKAIALARDEAKEKSDSVTDSDYLIPEEELNNE